MKKQKIIFFTVTLLFLGISGCRTFAPTESDENPQPWAQPENWQKTQGLPGFSSGAPEDY